MKHTYKVSGMTCAGCQKSVQEALLTVEGVENVEIHLELKEAIVQTNQHVPIRVLQEALPKKYTLSKKATENIFKSTTPVQETSELKQLFPLFLILLYITVASTLLNINPWNLEGFMLDFMGLFYIVFSFFKMLDLKGFPISFRMYDPLAKVFPIYAWVYPFIETVLGLLFLMRFKIPVALVATILILGITTVGVTKVLLDKKSIPCACLGTALKLPMTKATFIENAIMLVMAIFMLVNYM